MLHTLRFAFLLGTLFMPLVIYILMGGKSDTFWEDMLIVWIVLILASLMLKAFTNVKQKAGNTMTRWWSKRKKNAKPEPTPEPDPVMERAASMPYLPTGFIYEVGELAFVGEFISMGIGLFPGLCIGILLSYLFPGIATFLSGRLLIAVVSSACIAWILFLEKRYSIKLNSPLFGLPLKWLLIPMFIFLVFYGDPNR